ncbi:fimbria/pilus outer membrane usher protein, partial [Escherichia coli]
LSYQHQGNETTAGANLTWNAPVATVNGSYSQSSTYRQAGASVSGGIDISIFNSWGIHHSKRFGKTVRQINATRPGDNAPRNT